MSQATIASLHELPALPYAEDALEPVISGQTVAFHYHKHHRGYVDNLNKLVAGTPFAGASLKETVLRAAGDPEHVGVFNNAGQAWNHAFYWRSLRPAGGGRPPAALLQRLEADFGGFDRFKQALAAANSTPGWAGWSGAGHPKSLTRPTEAPTVAPEAASRHRRGNTRTTSTTRMAARSRAGGDRGNRLGVRSGEPRPVWAGTVPHCRASI